MAMNHCGVLRKMTGFLERQECGYWCFRRPRAMSAFASMSALMTASLASPLSPFSVSTRLPSKPGASLVKTPSASTVKGMVVSMPRCFQLGGVRHPDLVVVGAVAGRGVHEAGAGVLGDVLAVEQRHVEAVADELALQGIRSAAADARKRDRRAPSDDTARSRVNASTFAAFMTSAASLSARISLSPGLRPVSFRRCGDLIEAVVDPRGERDRAVAGDGPRGRRPDHDRCAGEIGGSIGDARLVRLLDRGDLRPLARVGDRELHPDRVATDSPGTRPRPRPAPSSPRPTTSPAWSRDRACRSWRTS